MCDLQERNYNMLHTIHKLKEPYINIANIVMMSTSLYPHSFLSFRHLLGLILAGLLAIQDHQQHITHVLADITTTINLTDAKYHALTRVQHHY